MREKKKAIRAMTPCLTAVHLSPSFLFPLSLSLVLVECSPLAACLLY